MANAGQSLRKLSLNLLSRRQAENADAALAILALQPEIDVVFTDVRMPGSMDGLALAKWVTEHRPRIAVIVANANTAKDSAVKELCGAMAFNKPYNLDEVTQHIRKAIQARRVN